MYESFFGLKEKPFNMTPDPEYIFFTNQHREAFAHLVYGIRERRGFIEITGEVGTGKTTLCRAILNEFDENTRIALILNPMLSDIELLRTINDELFIERPGESKKELLDSLNAYLIEQHSNGRNVVLLIDESQNLSDETLEQIRIISNLETVKAKLIQIVLVGQPELRFKLDKEELRQLNQRITVRYHLGPLSLKETEKYIAHRLRVAGSKGRIRFTKQALKEIHRFSKGVPRKINVICDHALLTAFVKETVHIDQEIVQRAWKEIEGPGPRRRKRASLVRRMVVSTGAVVAVGLLLAAGALFFARQHVPWLDDFVTKSVGLFASLEVPSIPGADQGTGEENEADTAVAASDAEEPGEGEATPEESVASEAEAGEEVVEEEEAAGEATVAAGEEEAVETELESGETAEAAPEETEEVAVPEPETVVLALPADTEIEIAPPLEEPVTGEESTGEAAAATAEEEEPEATGSLWAAMQESLGEGEASEETELETAELPDEAYGDGELDAQGILHTTVPERNGLASVLSLAYRWRPEEFPIYHAYRAVLAEEKPLEEAVVDIGLEVRRLTLDHSQLCLLDLPAAIEIREPEAESGMKAVVLEADLESVLVSIPSDGSRRYRAAELAEVWSGETWLCLPWGSTEEGTMGREAAGPAVRLLESRLARLGLYQGTPDDRFDEKTEAALRSLQEKYGLEAHGTADPETQVLLFALTSGSEVPSLNFQLAAGSQ